MRWLLLVVLSSPALAESWEWKLVTGGGRPDQVLFVLKGPSPPGRRVIETWRLTIDAPGESGRALAHFQSGVGKARTTVDFELWNEKGTWLYVPAADPKAKPLPFVERDPLPHALSTERVGCRSELLGGFGAMCTALPDGPLAAPLVPLTITVDPGKGESLIEQLVVPVLTAGLILPGTSDTSVVAYLTPRTPKLSADIERWKKGARRVADLPPTLDAETAGAMLVLAETPRAELLTELGRRVPTPIDRWPLLRLARDRDLKDRDALVVVAALSNDSGLETTEKPLVDSATQGIQPLVLAGITELVAGRAPTLRTHLVKPERATFEAETWKLLERGDLATSEAGALVMALSPAARRKQFPRALEALPTIDGVALLQSETSQRTPTEVEALLLKAPKWVDRLAREGQLVTALRVLPFDDSRARVLNASLTRLSEAERGPALVSAFEAFSFDDERLKLLARWKGSLASVPGASAVGMIRCASRSETRLQVYETLSSVVGPAEVPKLRLAVVESASFDDERLKVLERPIDSLSSAEALALIKPFSSDSSRTPAVCRLLPLVPAPEQPDFLVAVLSQFSFPHERVAVLRCSSGAAKRLSAAGRQKVLELFSSFDRAEVERLLQ